jgi:hypothetical protein
VSNSRVRGDSERAVKAVAPRHNDVSKYLTTDHGSWGKFEECFSLCKRLSCSSKAQRREWNQKLGACSCGTSQLILGAGLRLRYWLQGNPWILAQSCQQHARHATLFETSGVPERLINMSGLQGSMKGGSRNQRSGCKAPVFSAGTSSCGGGAIDRGPNPSLMLTRQTAMAAA